MAVEEIKPYDKDTGKAQQVEQMFDTIAPSYDFMNHAMTFGLDRVWRNKALRILRKAMSGSESLAKPHILDVACGTGDVTFSLREEFSPSFVDGVDLSTGMLRQAEQKLHSPHYSRFAESITFREADCLDLPFSDCTYDAVTVAYGVRNFENLEKGYREMLRVLKPGATICVIELCEPALWPVRMLYRIYSRCIIPLMGKIVSGDRKAYSYLLDSISRCPDRKRMTSLMEKAGFSDAKYHTLFPGTVAVYTARRP